MSRRQPDVKPECIEVVEAALGAPLSALVWISTEAFEALHGEAHPDHPAVSYSAKGEAQA